MTTSIRAFAREPFDFALSQPHQLAISSASVAIVALEAGTLIPWPFNILLAIGAEWAYLRGLISGAGIKTRWAAALNISAVMLVVLYGGLWGLRGFHLIPDAPPAWAAVVLTIIHIGAISAVTLCSAMLHRVGEDTKALAIAAAKSQDDQEAADERAYQADLQRQRDQQQLQIEAEWKRAQLQIDTERQQAQLSIERDRARAELRANARAPRNATKKVGTVPLATGKTALCCKCQKQVAWSTPSEAGTIKRWGCAECRSGANTQD